MNFSPMILPGIVINQCLYYFYCKSLTNQGQCTRSTVTRNSKNIKRNWLYGLDTRHHQTVNRSYHEAFTSVMTPLFLLICLVNLNLINLQNMTASSDIQGEEPGKGATTSITTYSILFQIIPCIHLLDF